MTEPTPEAALTVLERRARQGCQSSSALSEVLAALDTLRTLAARVAAVEALCDQADQTTNLDWRGIVTTDDLRSIIDPPEGEWQPGDPLPEPLQPTVEIGGQVMTQAQFDAARHPLLTVDPGPTVAGDAMEVNSDTPEGEQ